VAFVLDASAAASLIFADEPDPADLDARFSGGETALVPTIFRWEIANLLVTALRGQRIDLFGVVAQFERLSRLPIEETSLPRQSGTVIDLSVTQRLSAYDAGYLDLALRTGLPLATRDRRLASAADSCGVQLIQV
jgi:predicted nucleic acid-binding protein